MSFRLGEFTRAPKDASPPVPMSVRKPPPKNNFLGLIKLSNSRYDSMGTTAVFKCFLWATDKDVASESSESTP